MNPAEAASSLMLQVVGWRAPAWCWGRRGLYLYRKEDWQNASYFLEHAFRRQPKPAWAGPLARCYEKSGNRRGLAELAAGLLAMVANARRNGELSPELRQAVQAVFSGWDDLGGQAWIAGRREAAFSLWQEAWQFLQKAWSFDSLSQRQNWIGPDWAQRVGHLGLLDAVYKIWKLGLGFAGQPVLAIPQNQSANPALLRALVRSWPRLRLAGQGEQVGIRRLHCHWVEDGLSPQGAFFFALADRAQRRWEALGKGPWIRPGPTTQRIGEDYLRSCGWQAGQRWVTLHVRNPAFHREAQNRDLRDADLETYLPTVKYLISLGAWIVLLGSENPAFSLSHPRLILKPCPLGQQAELDLFFMTGPSLFVGTNSGPWVVAAAVGVPCLLTNWFPCHVAPWYGNTLTLLKNVFHVSGRPVGLRELLQDPLGSCESEAELATQGYQVEDNTPAQILSAVREKTGQLGWEGAPQDPRKNTSRLQKKASVLFRRFGATANVRLARESLRKL